MKKLLIAGALAASVALGGCASQGLQLNSQVSLNTLDGVVGVYGTALSAERAYKALPLCKTGTKFSAANPCAQRSIVVRLQNADAVAIAAITRANAFVKAYPTVDATNVISAAASAVSALQAVLNATGVN